MFKILFTSSKMGKKNISPFKLNFTNLMIYIYCLIINTLSRYFKLRDIMYTIKYNKINFRP